MGATCKTRPVVHPLPSVSTQPGPNIYSGLYCTYYIHIIRAVPFLSLRVSSSFPGNLDRSSTARRPDAFLRDHQKQHPFFLPPGLYFAMADICGAPSSPPPLPGRSSSHSSRSSKASLSLDLSNLPPLTQPTLPTNTLLFTNLQDPEIFRPDNLQTIRDLINATAPVYTWSPLKSFRRIVMSFLDEQSAIKVRGVWDGEAIMGGRCRVYFGQATPLDLSQDRHLALPDAGKLFFLSPPPSPPQGWETKLEDAPNKQVHADDLAEALAQLHKNNAAPVDCSPVSPVERACAPAPASRSRSSTMIFQPDEHGNSPDLPAIAVEDLTDSPMEMSPVTDRPSMAQTARPPLELME